MKEKSFITLTPEFPIAGAEDEDLSVGHEGAAGVFDVYRGWSEDGPVLFQELVFLSRPVILLKWRQI